jgi:2-keto-4-pentenoate hydratase/2-oxohepta-3-ene-1,7-dioic acid hydratase in catechol pathway
VVKTFSYTTDKGKSNIGFEYEGQLYNFSQAWELYKTIKNNGRGPSLSFLQIMVEADFLHAETFHEVMSTLKEYRSLHDLRLSEPLNFQLPIGRPQKLLCIGRNYRKHAEELGNPVPAEPIFFAKSPSALLPHNGQIRLPQSSGRVDFEGELAVVIGKQCHNISPQYAFDFIAGYTIINDVTARDLQAADKKLGHPWFRSKNFDTFCPCGPYLIPQDAVPDYRDLSIETRLNGDVRQQASLSELLFDIGTLVAYLSKYCTLVPGDIIATGTPEGVAPLQPGDVVEVEISTLGVLSNSVV